MRFEEIAKSQRPARNRMVLLLCLLISLFSAVAYALAVPARPAGRVSDYAGLLSQDVKDRLESELAAFEKSDSTQIAVAIFPSLEGESLEDFSIRLAQGWGIGQKDKNNGAILLIFRDDRKMRIEVGYGLEHKLTDALASEIIRNVIVPEFKSGRFDQGVVEGVSAIIAAVRGTYVGESQPSFYGLFAKVMLYAFLFGLWLFISYLMAKSNRGTLVVSGSGWSGGFGSGGWGGSSGGGFSGGGGSFGGGGSSGSW